MNDFFRLRIRVWGLLTAAGACGIVGSLAGFLGDFAWWMDLGSHFRVQYVLLFSVLGVCFWLGRRRRWAFTYLTLAIINAIPISLYLLPLAEELTDTGSLIRTMQVNVNTQHGNPERVMKSIREESPDVVMLEEINDKWLKALSPLMKEYPYRLVEARDDNFGIGLLSRVPLTTTQIVYFGSAEVPSIIATTTSLTIVATHPLPPGGPEYSSYRNEQLKDIADKVSTIKGAVVLIGDLNVTPWSPHYRRFTTISGLKNASEGRGIYPSWPSFSPLMMIPIDHFLHSIGVSVHSVRIGSHVGSDHFPVIVDFAVDE